MQSIIILIRDEEIIIIISTIEFFRISTLLQEFKLRNWHLSNENNLLGILKETTFEILKLN